MKHLYALFLITTFILCSQTGKSQHWEWVNMATGIHSSGEGSTCATDKNGNAYVTGCFYGTEHFDNDSLVTTPGWCAVYVTKYDSSGHVVWTRQSSYGCFISTGQIANSITVDQNGNVYIAGQFTDTIVFGSTMLKTPGPGYTMNYFLVKYDPNGNFMWAKSAQCGNDPNTGIFVNSISHDSKGNVYITGQVYDGVDTIGPSILNFRSFFLAKYNSNGTALWAYETHLNNTSVGNSITLDKNDNIYVTGFFNPILVFGATTLHTNGQNELFLAKFDTNGNNIWAIQSDSSNVGERRGYSVTSDNSGHLYVTGTFSHYLSFGRDSAYSLNHDIFISKFNSSGAYEWTRTCKILDTNRWTGWALAADTLNHVYFSGAPYISGANRTFSIAYAQDTFNAVAPIGFEVPTLFLQLDTAGKLKGASILTGGGDDNNYVCTNQAGTAVYLGGDLADRTIFDNITENPHNEAPFVAKWVPYVPSLGVEKLPGKVAAVNLYPNPNNGIFNLSIRNGESEIKGTLEFYNILGEKIYSNSFNLQSSTFKIDISSQPAGIYLYKLATLTGELIATGKVALYH